MEWSKEYVARYARTLLILGRVSNLPTVWSNVSAGWILAHGGSAEHLFFLLLGATFLYLAGMFLNDAWDADFDRQHRPERPIPSGAITPGSVWQWGISWLVLGLLCFGLLGRQPLLWAVALAGTILLYDAVHKVFALAPLLMALCRFLLVLLAAAATNQGINGLTVWAALVLSSYIVGLSFLARKESLRSPLAYWPCLLLTAPLVLGLIVHRGPYQFSGRVFILSLFLWILEGLRHAFWSYQPNVGRAVSRLLAGIILVDLVAVGGEGGLFLLFVFLFLLALAFQRFIPPT